MSEANGNPPVEQEGTGDIELPGRQLCEAREARGLSIRQVASELHVSERLLVWLEEDEFDRIGAPIFVKGHLRNYARLLGLDPAPLVEAFERSSADTTPDLLGRKGDGIPMEVNSGGAWLKGFGWFLVVMLLLVTAGWWYYQQEQGDRIGAGFDILAPSEPEVSRPVSDGVQERDAADTGESELSDAEIPADPRAQLMSPEERAESSPGSGEASAADQDDMPAAADGVDAETDESDSPAATDQARDAGTEEPVQQTAPAEAAQGTMLLEFDEASWVEVYNAAEEVLLYDLVPADASRRVDAGGEVRVFLGNAPAVSMMVNGENFDVQRFVRRDNTARFRVNLSPGDRDD